MKLTIYIFQILFPLVRKLRNMGNQSLPVHLPSMQQYNVNVEDYRLVHRSSEYVIWENSCTNESMIEYKIQMKEERELLDQIESFKFRNRHHLVVGSLYWQFGRRNYVGSSVHIFYQRIYTNLARIKDIPFLDSLHFYYVALKGFEMLYRRFGFFQVTEHMFHLSYSRKLKVWCSQDVSAIRPSQSSSMGNQTQMVKKIIQIIDQNTDQTPNSFPIGSTLYEEASMNFASALHKLKELCQKNEWSIPDKLSCLDKLPKGTLKEILDEYVKDRAPCQRQLREKTRKVRGLNLSKSCGKARSQSPHLDDSKIKKRQGIAVGSNAARPQSITIYNQETNPPELKPRSVVIPARSQSRSIQKRTEQKRPSHQPQRVVIQYRGTHKKPENEVAKPYYFQKPKPPLNPFQIHQNYHPNHERIELKQSPKPNFFEESTCPAAFSFQRSYQQKYETTPMKIMDSENQQNEQIKNALKLNFNQEKKSPLKIHFNEEKKQSKSKANDKIFTKPELWAQIQEIKKKYSQFYPSNKDRSVTTYNFERNILKTPEKIGKEEKKIDNQKQQRVSYLPSITDISNNLSQIQSKGDQYWMDKNHELVPPKKYNPSIDEDIWSDVLKLRSK